jgi:signal transduction histidine kinase
MSLSRKFITVLILSIFIVAIVNIVAFYVLYTSFLKVYLSEKIDTKNSITIDYINDIIKKQTEDEIDNIFSDSEIEFFELLEINSWEIPLNEEKNRDIVVNYLVKSWLSPKYIEELIPSDNLSKILDNIKDKDSPEYNFITRLTWGILVTNLLAIAILSIFIWYFIRKTILPIKEVTSKIKKLKPWKENSIIEYNKRDEVWLLISSINWLNKRLNVQKTIRSRLLADISHELKTPITSIWCYLEWITDWVIKLDKKNLSAITDEMNRLISLVNRIMNYEKFENQKLELDLKEYNISDLVKQVTETHKKNLKENKQRIKIAWDEYKIIKLDKNLFKQIVHNLIWNFLKYSWKNTILKINITTNYIDFLDNWAWVIKSELPYLTEKFYQADKEKSWNAEKRWIWVWLSLVNKIIERHDWSYEIKSDTRSWFGFKIFF